MEGSARRLSKRIRAAHKGPCPESIKRFDTVSAFRPASNCCNAVPMQLRKTLTSTNVIESAFSTVERVCRNVKRWHAGDQRERWVGSGLLVAQKQFRRITGYKHIPVLIRELEAQAPMKVVKPRKAS